MTEATSSLATADYIVVAGFFSVMIGVGVFFGRKASNVAGFFGGDK